MRCPLNVTTHGRPSNPGTITSLRLMTANPDSKRRLSWLIRFPNERRVHNKELDEVGVLDAHRDRDERLGLATITMVNGYLDWPDLRKRA